MRLELDANELMKDIEKMQEGVVLATGVSVKVLKEFLMKCKQLKKMNLHFDEISWIFTPPKERSPI